MIRKSAHNQDEISRILDTCLELVTSGSGSVDSIIEQYPEYSEVLRPPLEAALWLQSRSEVFNPRPGFVQLSRHRLVNRFQGNDGAASSTSTETLSRIPAFFQERRIVVQYSALLTLTAVLMFVGYRSTAFLVQRSIPGDPLYDAKLVQEEFRLSLSTSDEDQARLRIQFAQRRVIEMQELILVGRTWLLDQTLENFQYQMDEAAAVIMVIAETDESSAAELSSFFAETLNGPMSNLVGILNTSPEIVSANIMNTLMMAAAEIFDSQPFEFMVESVTSTPANAFSDTTNPTATFTATETFTATFTSTVRVYSEPSSTVQPSNPPPQAVEPSLTPTPPPSNTPPPPDPTNTPIPIVEPTNTSAPTVEPTNTPEPPPTEEPATPIPEETKKPKPTPRPTNTHRPTQKPTEEN